LSSAGITSDRILNSQQQTEWCEALYQSKGSELVLYGRALGLSHGEAEDVLQETFIALMATLSSPLPTRALLCSRLPGIELSIIAAAYGGA